MFILTRDNDNFINYDKIINLKIVKEYRPDIHWEIIAVYSGGHIIIDIYHTERECKNDFNKLCNKIAGQEYEIIDMNDLYDE